MKSIVRVLAAGLLGWGTVSGCTCDRRLGQRTPHLEFASEHVDFGNVQIQIEHTRTLTLKNSGSAELTVTNVETAAPFGIKTAVPFSVGIASEVEVALTYLPTVANVRDVGTLTIQSDDPLNPSASVPLSGQGIQAVALAEPTILAFGDVDVDGKKTLPVKIKNLGSAALRVLSAKVEGSGLSADVTPLLVEVAPGAVAQADVTFEPKAQGQLESAALKVMLDPLQGGTLTVPITGRGVRAVPRLCWKFDDQGTESCTDPNPVGGVGGTVNVPFGALCDNRLYPSDGGAPACGNVPWHRSGRIYVKNEGNVPVKYSLKFISLTGSNKNPCKEAQLPPADFQSSNASAANVYEWSEPTVQLPSDETANPPWQSPEIAVTYRPTARCASDVSEQAQVWFTRADKPQTLLLILTGASALPLAERADWACGSAGSEQSVPCSAPFFGVVNRGYAPFRVTGVVLHEELFLPDGGSPDAGGPNGGYYPVCDFTNPFSNCARFAWAADAGDPNRVPFHTIPAGGISGQPAQVPIGRMVFGPDGGTECVQPGGACPGVEYRIWAEISTTDPFNPKVHTKIQGAAKRAQ